jgi:glycosyltransferase involved in cell wall biosynthesis
VTRQTYSRIEIIVVDDASDDSDDLERSLDRLCDSRIRLIKHEVNLGGAAARNSGVAAATGEFIAFLDSDDEWLPSYLEKKIILAQQLGDTDWLIYNQSEVITTQSYGLQKSVMPLRGIGQNETIGDYLFVQRGWLQTSSFFLRKELARRVCFNPKLRRHQDYDLLLRLEATGCRFEMIAQPLVVVHWEDLHQTARGLNPAQSMAFLGEYHALLSPRARSGFVFGQIVMRLLGASRRVEAIWYFVRYVRLWHLGIVQHSCVISGLVFGDARIARRLADSKRFLNRFTGGQKQEAP